MKAVLQRRDVEAIECRESGHSTQFDAVQSANFRLCADSQLQQSGNARLGVTAIHRRCIDAMIRMHELMQPLVESEEFRRL